MFAVPGALPWNTPAHKVCVGWAGGAFSPPRLLQNILLINYFLIYYYLIVTYPYVRLLKNGQIYTILWVTKPECTQRLQHFTNLIHLFGEAIQGFKIGWRRQIHIR